MVYTLEEFIPLWDKLADGIHLFRYTKQKHF
jgi:hypothetical protein